jgi:hypothetical protein
VAFTFDNNTNRDANVYYALNKALRNRKASVQALARVPLLPAAGAGQGAALPRHGVPRR